MQKLLLVAGTEKNINDFVQIIQFNHDLKLDTAVSCQDAKTKFYAETYDIVLINAPLPDGFGDRLALDIATQNNAQVILISPSASYDACAARMEKYGVFVIGRPISANLFWTTIRLATASRNKLKQLNDDNTRLREKIEDIRLVDRAKCCLIQALSMTEEEAHKYIERKAMDTRVTKKEVAIQVLKTYEY